MTITNERTLNRFRYAACCEICRRRVCPLDPHHWTPTGLGGGSRLDIACNLASLCRCCHDDVHAKRITKRKVLEVIAEREGLSEAVIQETIWLLLRLPKGASNLVIEQALVGEGRGVRTLTRKTIREAA